MKRKVLLAGSIFCLLVISFCIWRIEYSSLAAAEKKYLNDELKELTKQEKKDLEYVFEHLFFFDSFGFSLFGTKPICLAQVTPKEEFLRGWKTWKKISPKFHTEEYILEEIVYKGYPLIVFANVDLVEKTYLQHQHLFEQEFNGQMTLKRLKECLKTGDNFFCDLMSNDLILGILFGFGERNARLYSERKNMPQEDWYPMTFFCNTHPIYYLLLNDVYPPGFICDSHSEETKELKHRYKKERLKMRKLGRSTLFYRMLLKFKRLSTY